MLIDTHAHLNFPDFKKDRKKVIQQCLNQDVWMINIGTDLETSRRAVQISRDFKKGIYAAIGLHPLYLKQGFEKDKYLRLAGYPKVVGIGEVGLDYLKLPEDLGPQKRFKHNQAQLFKQQLSLANQLDLPLIIHCRMAHNDLLEILEGKTLPSRPGVIHCFTGTWRQAQQYLDLGFYLGFNGIIFKLDLKEVVQKTPLDRIVIETDCPYLVPPGFSSSRNNPLAVQLVAKEISQIKGKGLKQMGKITFQNAERLFGL